jgi:hypothetical protein
MGGEDFDYDFGAKRHWRRWVWNRIRERLGVEVSQAMALYLSGAEDYDRQIAIDRGFSDVNLISIEKSGKVAVKVRKEKKILCVRGDAFRILNGWPPTKRVDVLHLDLCGGLYKRMLLEILGLVMLEPLFGAVLSFNLMCGMEGTGGDLRDAWAEERRVSKAPHRGMIVYSEFATWAFALTRGRVIRAASGEFVMKSLSPEEELNYRRDFDATKRAMVEVMRPVVNSYMSTSGQRFDSVVFVNPLRIIPEGYFDNVEYRASMSKTDEVKKARRAIAPIFAHRTMRINEGRS